MLTDLAKPQSARGAFQSPAVMGSCLTISHTCLPCLPSRWVISCVSGAIEGSEDTAFIWTKGDPRSGELSLRPSTTGLVNNG